MDKFSFSRLVWLFSIYPKCKLKKIPCLVFAFSNPFPLFSMQTKTNLQNDLQKKFLPVKKFIATIYKTAFVSQLKPCIISHMFKESTIFITVPTFLACQVTLHLGAGSSIARILARQLIEKQIWSMIQNTFLPKVIIT